MNAWIGIDCGYSHLSVSVLDPAGETVANRRVHEPLGDGHAHDVALARLQNILRELSPPAMPTILAGYCYSHSGVRETFVNAGWPVVDVVPLNDVVGVYGLTNMAGHVVLAGCGSFSQVVYIDRDNNICWPADELVATLPDWPLSGDAYLRFMHSTYGVLQGSRLLSDTLDQPETQQYLHQAAQAIWFTRNKFWALSGQTEPPQVIVGGGGVSHWQLWAQVRSALNAYALVAERVVGDQAAGLAKFALHNRDANAWMYIGDSLPGWLS